MISLGAGVIIVESGKVLLTKRKDLEVWYLPGGRVDEGESLAETAVREAHEETGLEVVIDGLVDVYHNPPSEGGASIFILYRAHAVGGTLQAGDDADGVGFFARDQLPELAFISTRDSIQRLWPPTATA